MDGDGVEFRILVAVRLDKRQFIGCNVILQKDGIEAWHCRNPLQALAQLRRIKMQAGGDAVEIGVDSRLSLIAQQQRRKRRIVVDNDAAFAIENLAARRQDGNFADAVHLRLRSYFSW